MKKANSFSKININSKIDDEEEKMFFSMKETLHNPLKIIKSKELLDFFYKDNYSTEKEKKSTNVNSSNKKDKNTFYETNKINKDINFEELEETNNKTEDKNILLNNENNYEIEKDYEDIIYTTTPMIYPDNNNFDKLEEGEKNKEIIDTEPRKEGKEKNKEKKSENKKAWNKIKNIAKDITEKINSFKICETTSKYSIEQSYPKNNINQFYKTITDLNNQILPFEFINYSFSELEKNNKENLKKIKKEKKNNGTIISRLVKNKNYKNVYIIKYSDQLFKILLLGDSGVGKSSIILRYTENEFNASLVNSIGVDFKSKDIELNNQKIKIQIWDTAGHERFKSITTSYYRGANAIVIVYDITERETFEHIEKWLNEIEKYAKENVLKFLVGNKIDLNDNRSVSYDEGKNISEKYGIMFFETSAKDNIDINELFEKSTLTYLNKYNLSKDNQYKGVNLNTLVVKTDDQKSFCCF